VWEITEYPNVPTIIVTVLEKINVTSVSLFKCWYGNGRGGGGEFMCLYEPQWLPVNCVNSPCVSDSCSAVH